MIRVVLGKLKWPHVSSRSKQGDARSEGTQSHRVPAPRGAPAGSVQNGPRPTPQSASHILPLTLKTTPQALRQTQTQHETQVHEHQHLCLCRESPCLPVPEASTVPPPPPRLSRCHLTRVHQPTSGFNDHCLKETYPENWTGRKSLCLGGKGGGCALSQTI